MKVLLLNPPGKRLYLRDYYCSKVAKARYAYSPADLLFLSARFQEVEFLDAVWSRLGPEACLGRISAAMPDHIVSLVGAVSWSEDRAFLASVKAALPRAKILASGDVLLESGERIMAEEPWLDGIILDYSNADAFHFLSGHEQRIRQMIFRNPDGGVVVGNGERRHETITDMPRPRHELFLDRGYLYPFVRGRRFATVQTDYGCPFGCTFCVMGRLGYRIRPVAEVTDELEWLRCKGVREIYFNDQTFGGDQGRLQELCTAMVERDLGQGWCCWSRADVVEGHLGLMNRAGCHTIMFGVESASQETLRRYRKGLDLAQIRRVFSQCRDLGIRTLGTYIIGLPNEDRADMERTVRLAIDLDGDYASFNVFVPRKGSEWRAFAAKNQAMPDDETALDQTGDRVLVSSCPLSPSELKAIRDRAMRRFYLRPRYLGRQLLSVRTPYDAANLVRMALTMCW